MYAKFKNSEHPAYKAVAKKSKKELKRCRRNSDKQLASNIKEDAKSFYAYAGSKNKSSKIGPLLDDNGNVTSTEQDMAREFNQFFTTVFTKDNISTVPMIQQMYCQYGQMLDIHVDDVVMKKLSKLHQDKAPGADNI